MKDGLLDRNDGLFAADLKRLRTQQGMTAQELAERAGCTPQCIGAYESGKRHPQWDTVHAFNDVLNGRNALGMEIVDSPEGARQVFFGLESVPKDLFAAEAHRRLLAGTSE